MNYLGERAVCCFTIVASIPANGKYEKRTTSRARKILDAVRDVFTFSKLQFLAAVEQ